jgi:hypothetical protein
MTTLYVRTAGVSVGVVTLALAFCALGGWSASADTTAPVETGVVDAFISARAAGDVATVASLLDERVRIIDSSRDRSDGPDAFYQVLPPGDTLAFGARSRSWDGSVVWTEVVLENGRPSWENNLNWWMDDNSVADAARTRGATTYVREMRALVVDAKIAQLIVVRTDPQRPPRRPPGAR